MKDINNRIDWIAAKEKEAEIIAKRQIIIEHIEECACELHNAYFGEDFSREALLKSEEFLSEFASYLKSLNRRN